MVLLFILNPLQSVVCNLLNLDQSEILSSGNVIDLNVRCYLLLKVNDIPLQSFMIHLLSVNSFSMDDSNVFAVC